MILFFSFVGGPRYTWLNYKYVGDGQSDCTIEVNVFNSKLISDTNTERCVVATEPTGLLKIHVDTLKRDTSHINFYVTENPLLPQLFLGTNVKG